MHASATRAVGVSAQEAPRHCLRRLERRYVSPPTPSLAIARPLLTPRPSPYVAPDARIDARKPRAPREAAALRIITLPLADEHHSRAAPRLSCPWQVTKRRSRPAPINHKRHTATNNASGMMLAWRQAMHGGESGSHAGGQSPRASCHTCSRLLHERKAICCRKKTMRQQAEQEAQAGSIDGRRAKRVSNEGRGSE